MRSQQSLSQIGRNGWVRPELYLSATTGYHIWSSTLQIKGPNCGRLAMERHLTPFDAMNWVFPKLLYLIRVKRNVIQAFA
jgi:hypothetical protein